MAGKRKTTRGRASQAQAPCGAADRKAIIAAAMALFAGRGWRETGLGDIAAAAGMSLAELHATFASKSAVLEAFSRDIDRAALATGPEESDSIRDRLFELMMRRFDALKPHREALVRLSRELPGDPPAMIAAGCRILGFVRATAELAGVGTAGPLGMLRVKALAAAYGWAFRAFLGDDSADLARTMKALDQALSRLEMLARSMPGARRDRAAEATAA
jgi:AcrR family transcriptional regulator